MSLRALWMNRRLSDAGGFQRPRRMLKKAKKMRKKFKDLMTGKAKKRTESGKTGARA